MQLTICPCGNNYSYQECCEVYHKGSKLESALALMRSRYSAYALGLTDYIMHTTHPDFAPTNNRQNWKEGIEQFSKYTLFEKLDILKHEENGEEAIVIFVAHLKVGSKDRTFTEKSYFKQEQGQWLYQSGRLAEGALSLLLAEKL